MKKVINSFNEKKACDPDGINFIIIQKIFKIIPKIFELLDKSQIEGRKNYSTLNGIIELVHEIQLANQNKRIMFCLFLDIKEAFDYINKNQLLKIMNRAKLSQEIFKWIKNFMKKRKIQLNFNDSQNDLFDIQCELFQRFPISSIL